MNPEEQKTLKQTLLIASITSAILLAVLHYTEGDFMILGGILFILIFASLLPYGAYRKNPKNRKLKAAAMLATGILFGGSFVFIESLFFSLGGQLLDWREITPPRMVLSVLMIIVAYAYYKILRGPKS